MDDYSEFPPAPDSADGIHSAAVKGGVAGGIILLLIVVIIYVILRNGGCSMNCGVRVGGASRSAVEEA
jgi:hypothetical protein